MTTVVLDTNLLVAARWNKGSSSLKIVEMCISRMIRAAYTREVMDENMHILSKVKAGREYMKKIDAFYDAAMRVECEKRIRACVDESDNRFLEAAAAANADFVISNDHHLLDLVEYEGIRIVRPKTFMMMFA